MALLEASSNNVGSVLAEAVANMVSQDVPEQIETCRQSTIRSVLVVLILLFCLASSIGVRVDAGGKYATHRMCKPLSDMFCTHLFQSGYQVELSPLHLMILTLHSVHLTPSKSSSPITPQPPGAGVRRAVPVCRARRLHGEKTLRLLGVVSGVLGAGTRGAGVDHADGC